MVTYVNVTKRLIRAVEGRKGIAREPQGSGAVTILAQTGLKHRHSTLIPGHPAIGGSASGFSKRCVLPYWFRSKLASEREIMSFLDRRWGVLAARAC